MRKETTFWFCSMLFESVSKYNSHFVYEDSLFTHLCAWAFQVNNLCIDIRTIVQIVATVTYQTGLQFILYKMNNETFLYLHTILLQYSLFSRLIHQLMCVALPEVVYRWPYLLLKLKWFKKIWPISNLTKMSSLIVDH